MEVDSDKNLFIFKSNQKLKLIKLIWIKSCIEYIFSYIINLQEKIYNNKDNKNFVNTKRVLNNDLLDKYIASSNYVDVEDLLKLSNLISLFNKLLSIEKLITDKIEYEKEEEEKDENEDENEDEKKFSKQLDEIFNNLVEFDLIGLYWWLKINMEENYITPGQSMDIFHSLKHIKNSIKKHVKEYQVNPFNIEILELLLINSYKKNSPILLLFN